jgi:hypothetical protein
VLNINTISTERADTPGSQQGTCCAGNTIRDALGPAKGINVRFYVRTSKSRCHELLFNL